MSCFVCQCEDSAQVLQCTKSATVSGKSILNVVDQVFDLVQVDLASIICQICFEIADEIDALEVSLEKAKERLKRRRFEDEYNKVIAEISENVPCATFESDNHSFFIDRLLKKVKWKTKEASNLPQQAEIENDFETDLLDLYHKTPKDIDSIEKSDFWTSTLLRAECEKLELDIPGETKCLRCFQTFDTVLERIVHVQEVHQTNSVTCSTCQSNFKDEQSAFHHVTKSCNNNKLSDIISSRHPNITQDRSFKCLKCGILFQHEVSYWMHNYQRHPMYSKAKECVLCQQIVSNSANYRRHFLINHSNYVMQCQKCPLLFEDLDLDKILEHIKSLHESQNEDFEDVVQEESLFEEAIHAKKKSNVYVSKTLARSYRSEPLSSLEHYKANFDMALYPPHDPTKVITSFNEVLEVDREEAINTIDLMRNMPTKLESLKDQENWDIVMLKCQVGNLAFGIPGESLCFHCLETFNGVQERLNHQFYCDQDQSAFKCSICDQEFVDNTQLVKHLRKRHEAKERPAQLITISCGQKNSFDNGWIQCSLCSAKLANDLAYYFHHYESHKLGPESLDCKVCGKTSANCMEYKRHILIIHGGYTYACFICGKRYGSRDSISAHLRSHNKDQQGSKRPKEGKKGQGGKSQPQTCEECGWVSKSLLLHHRHLLATHGIQVAQTCQVCQEILPDPKALVEHKRSLHSNDICYICAKSYLTLSDLNLHISRMHPEMANLGSIPENAKHKPIKILSDKKEKTMCEVCSKMVLTHNIKLHMKNHQEKQLTCPKCPRTFRWNSSLTSHLSSAHGDQVKTVTSACEFCGKQFKDKSNLRQHRYSHTGGPYACKTCGRGFGRKDLLNSHTSKCSNSNIFQP